MFRQMLCQLTYSLPFQDLFSYFLSTNSVGVSQLGTAEADLGKLNAKLQVIGSLLFSHSFPLCNDFSIRKRKLNSQTIL